jgi:hypothetical protein
MSEKICCRKCWEEKHGEKAKALGDEEHGYTLMNPLGMPFIVCPTCGNKRCPRATDHRENCSGSNKPGQEGSIY